MVSDENPEWTEADFAAARPADQVHGVGLARRLVRPPGRPAMAPELRKERVTIRLSPDILAHFRAGGRGWQSRLEASLRDVIKAR